MAKSAKAAAKLSKAEAVGRVVEILEQFDDPMRTQVVSAVLTLIGDAGAHHTATQARPAGGGSQPVTRTPGSPGAQTASAYFEVKQPKNKLEELAVAARFREETEGADTHTKKDIKAVYAAARRNFDSGNFRRDLDNARTKGLFTRGTGRNNIVLATFGIKLVDALPNREAVAALPMPRGGKRKKAASQK